MSKLDLMKLTSDTKTLGRLVIAAGVLLVLAVAGFGAYYYYDRYYRPQPNMMLKGLSAAEQAVKEDPKNVEKRLNLAEAYVINGRNDDAITVTNKILLEEPDNQRGWLLVGISYARKNQPEAAVITLEKYVDANKDGEMLGLNRSLQTAGYYLGESYLKLGQPEKAVEVLEMVVDWSRTDADSMNLLGQAYIAVENYDGALLMFYSATTFVPDFREAYEGMAKVYEQTGQTELSGYAAGMIAYTRKDYQTAIDNFLQTAQAAPTFSATYVGLGMAYEAQGNLDEALKAYDTALMLNPDLIVANYGSQRVTTLLNK